MGSMGRLRIQSILLGIASMAFACAPMMAQKVKEVPADPPKVKELHLVERSVPFSLDARGNAGSIEFRTVDQMNSKDRDLVADAESSIGERARLAGIEFSKDKWNYQQVVCPALPNHIFLQFMRNNGTRDTSVFSASIPRSGDGKLRIIPILLRSYSLFSPAPINAMTISAFNHIRTEEHSDAAAEWLGTGLCYAALAGAQPRAALLADDPDGVKPRLAMPAELEIPDRGNVILTFADVSAVPRPMQWTMTFDVQGRLLKVTHKPADLVSGKVVPPTPIAERGDAVVPSNKTADSVPKN
jgi:hypothetical protein